MVRSPNARLAALRSFLKFAAHRAVASLQVVERALGIPVKRFERPMCGHLSTEEIQVVIQAPRSAWVGQRDHLLLPAWSAWTEQLAAAGLASASLAAKP
jgi:hypothetical protein